MDEIMATDYKYTWKMDFGYVMDNDDTLMMLESQGLIPTTKINFLIKKICFKIGKLQKLFLCAWQKNQQTLQIKLFKELAGDECTKNNLKLRLETLCFHLV